MNIIDRHPAPWTIAVPVEATGYCQGKSIVDANGGHVVCGEVVEMDGGGEVEAGIEISLDSGVERLILAAPELLEALRGCYTVLRRHTMTHEGRKNVEAREEWERAEALIVRIEGGE